MDTTYYVVNRSSPLKMVREFNNEIEAYSYMVATYGLSSAEYKVIKG